MRFLRLFAWFSATFAMTPVVAVRAPPQARAPTPVDAVPQMTAVAITAQSRQGRADARGAGRIDKIDGVRSDVHVAVGLARYHDAAAEHYDTKWGVKYGAPVELWVNVIEGDR